MKQNNYSSLSKLCEKLSQEVLQNLKNALENKDRAVLVLAGGSTPDHYLPHLFAMPFDWSRVDITLSDERWVAPNHPDSNEGLIRRHMISRPANAANFVGLWTNSSSPEDGLEIIEQRLKSLSKPFGAAILGMGNDGHFASIFPGTGAVDDKAPYCLSIGEALGKPRLSLSPLLLMSILNIHLVLIGTEKRRVLEQSLGLGLEDDLPVRLLTRTPAQDRLMVYSVV